MIDWLIANWRVLAIPLAAFLVTYAVGFWLRSIIDNVFERWTASTKWKGSRLVARTVHRAIVLWFLLLGVGIAIQVSVLSPQVKSISGKAIGSLVLLSVSWTVIVLCEHLLKMYMPRLKAPPATISLTVNFVRIAIIVVSVLAVLDIWGVPTTPILILIGVAVLAAALAFRNAAPNLFAGFQLGTGQHVKVGDYIKLETGEEGYVVETGWTNTRIKGLDQSTIFVPNSRLFQQTVINYGHPLKKAKEPFHFSSRTHLTELTGIKAKNLNELIEGLRKAPDASIYYHTHSFLETQYHLTPELSNDFSVWVTNSLGDESLGERLASVDTFGFPSLGALKERLVGIIEEYTATGSNLREAMPGEEFYFAKSVSVIFTIPYVAHDLREFVEALRKISLGSLYFHMFEARVRLGRGLNDFSIWLQESLGETELGDEIARVDPYTYTLEGLRSVLIQLIEKRIK